MSYSLRPPIGNKMKARAPPPPPVPQPAPRKIFRNAIPDGGATADTKENVVQTTVHLQLTLPNGYGTVVTIDGRKALMDVLVDLCAQFHLNPAEHALELTSADGHPVSFKPNTALGTLHADCVVIKHRTPEQRLPRKPAPKVPEQEEPATPKHTRAKKTVRLVVNYHRGQKAVVRVNPLVPLQDLLPVICQKCEFNPAHVLLLHDSVGRHQLDLRKSLTDLDIRELYALDHTLVVQSKTASAPALNFSAESLNSDSQSRSEKKGLLGLFNFTRRKSKTEEFFDDTDQRTNINGLSAVSSVCVETRPNTLGQSQSAMNLSRLSPKSDPKKRRAPPCPSAPSLTETQTQRSPAPAAQTKPNSSSQLKKRKAPPPPRSVQPTSSPTQRAVTAVPVPNITAASDDSMSDLSHSMEDSEPAASVCSSSGGDDDAESSSVTEEVMPEPTGPELNQQPARRSAAKREPDETALDLKMEEVDNSRQSTVVWLHAAEQEAETVSVCSSESLADQGYAASEGMADSPTTSPEDTVSLGPEPYLSPTQPRDDCDSDEGCATWGSRYSGNLRPGNQPVNRKDITAQIHLTLADLDADLADEFNLSDETSVCVYDEIPVSVVDMDIPVTAIDEVIDDDPISQSSYEAELCCSSKQSIDLQNQNNNACMSKKASPSPTDPIQSGDKKEPTGTVTLKSPAIKPDKQTLLPEPSQSPAMATGTPSAQNAPDLRSASTVQSHRKETTKVDRVLSVKAQNMISQSTASKYGLKTFTVVPNKPVAPQNHNKSESSLRIGAIKIDEFGNMVTPRETRDKPDRIDKASDDRDCPLLDKAKAFWSSASNEDSAPTTYKRSSVTSEDVETSKTLSLTVPSQPAEKTSVTEPPKQVNGPSTDLASAVSKKLAVSDPAENIFFSEHRKNLTFLKPSRRTSSQYVASAITKYTASSSDKVDEVKESQESTSDGQMKLTYHAFKNGPRPVQAASNHKVSTASENSVPFPAAKLHSSYPAEKQELSKEAQIIGAVVTGIKTRNSSSGNIKPLQQAWVSSCSEPTQSSTKECKPITMTTGNPLPLNITVNTSRPAVAKKPEIHILGLQPSPFGPVRKFKSVVPKLVEKETSLHSSLMDAIQSGNGMERLQKVCNSSKADMFKKPENERSALLSALRAENTSARLKKTSSSAAAELEKFRKSEETRTNRRYTTSTTPAALKISPSFTPPPPNFTSPPPNFTSPPPPLNFTSPPPPPNFTSPPPPPNFTSPPPPPNFTSPPPPPNFTSPPAPPPPNFIPPPPPTTPFSKPTVILPVGGNSECPREAMLEAIRSGAGAERLRKVPVSVKTVKVNGRLGTILAPASPPPQP